MQNKTGGEEQEINSEINNWKVSNYKTLIQVIKTFILSKLLFLATVFPADNKCTVKLN